MSQDVNWISITGIISENPLEDIPGGYSSRDPVKTLEEILGKTLIEIPGIALRNPERTPKKSRKMLFMGANS